MQIVYLNTRYNTGVETIDQFEREPKQTLRDFHKYIREMAREYHIAGINVYKSNRCTNVWKES